MKIAILSDIHGNSLALDAALAEIATIGVDEYWILGDLVALGPDPLGVLQRLSVLPNCKFIRGNTDRYVVTGDRPPPFASELGQDSEKIRIFAEVAGTFAWTLGVITAGGWLDWLSQLPLELETILPDETKCLCVHASPGNDDGFGIRRDWPDTEIHTLLQKCTADLICIGHTHQQINRKVDNWHILNPGSISNPRPPILEASYALLEATTEEYRVEHRTVEYNREEIILQVQKLRHPGAEFIIKHMRGEHK
ncbi:MAG TPA: metallophosphoesterase family protein [Anaerolineales bacterium]|nr:metallophosphoesterase family protein [Anaerolineales bacterium]